MLHYSKFKPLEIDFIRVGKKGLFANIAAGFDIETTSTEIGGYKSAFCYAWAMQLGHNNPVYYGRNLTEFKDFIELLELTYNLSDEKTLIIYTHNLGYEFQFIRKYFKWGNVFSIDERKPLKAKTGGVEFRCSYILSGFSLDNTAKNLTKHKINKLVGGLDYDLIRHNETPLTQLELDYLENDVLIITAYITEQIDIYSDICKIPLTNTGRVRQYVKNECYYSNKNHRKTSKGKYIKYRKIMSDLTLTPDIYIQLKRAFMGGFTHANAAYSGQVINDVSSLDFTSSYPSVMISEKYPMSRFRPLVTNSLKEFKKYCNQYAVIADIKLTGVKPKIEQENYISESKCYSLVNPVLNNGRVYSADELTTTITEIDLTIIEQCYTYEKIAISNANYAYKAYLPKAIVKSVLDLYQDKTTLKGVKGKEVEYLLSKGMLNSIYGMCVTDVVKDNAIYNDGWGVERVDVEEEIKKYNENKNRFLYYPWGVWVTAYARRNLWTGIIAAKNDYVYSDTDSLKVTNYNKLVNYVNWFNEQIIEKMENCLNFYKLDLDLLQPKTIKGETKMLGIWDFEGTYSRFKTLGAKRYLVEENGKLELTLAGLSKKNGLNYMLEKAGNNTEVFNMFNDNLYIPTENTGKMTHTYLDNELAFSLTDYQGNTKDVTSPSSIHLEKCEFTLSIAEQYKKFLKELSKGYIYKGLKQI